MRWVVVATSAGIVACAYGYMRHLKKVKAAARRAEMMLAEKGGPPAAEKLIPYSKQSVDEEDIAEVAKCLREPFLTTGPRVTKFEQAVAEYVHAAHGVACTSATAALHMAVAAAGISAGDEVIVSNMTFAASSNAVLYEGGTVVFADIDEATLNIDVTKVESLITPRTKAIIAVDLCGQPVNLTALLEISRRHGLVLIEDASHAIGATYDGKMIGSIADMTVFSFHPVKNMTTGEGGMLVTNNEAYAAKARSFRSHGIDLDFRKRQAQAVPHRYDMNALGYNYRLTDIQCALGLAQLKKLDFFIKRRQEVAAFYDREFAKDAAIVPVVDLPNVTNAHHLYVICLRLDLLTCDRDVFFKALRAENLGVNVHYMPVHYHSYYRDVLGFASTVCPTSCKMYDRIISLPCFPQMTEVDQLDVIHAVRKVAAAYKR